MRSKTVDKSPNRQLARQTVLDLIAAHGSFAIAAGATAAAAATTAVESMLTATMETTVSQPAEVGVYCRCVMKPFLDEVIAQVVACRPEDPVSWIVEYYQPRAVIPEGSRASSRRRCSTANSSDLMALVASLEEELATAQRKLIELETTSVRAPSRRCDSLTSSSRLTSDESSWDDADNLEDIRFETPRGFTSRPRWSVSAEASGEWALSKKQELLPKFPKTSKEKELTRGFLLDVPFLFSTLEPSQIETIIDALQTKDFSKGTSIVTQGEEGHELFILRRGQVDVSICVPWDTAQVVIAELGPGDVFGELALLYNTTRSASVIARTKVSTFSLDRLTFCQIVRNSAIERRARYEELLDSVPILTDLDKYQKSKIADALQAKSYDDGESVVRQGQDGDRFFIVASGSACAMKSFESESRCIATYESGDYFGEIALLRTKPCGATITAKGSLTVASLDRKSFHRLLGPLKQILMPNRGQ